MMAYSHQSKKIDFIFRNENDWEKVLLNTIKKKPEEIINELVSSELKGRGGVGFPAGLKWKLTYLVKTPRKYVICNANEGEPGTFKDREILSKVPFKLLTVMAVCGYVIGSNNGFIYLRREYKFLEEELKNAIKEFKYYCNEIDLDFTIKIFTGNGAFICGEETALINSLQGYRGEPQNKPPYPTYTGYLNMPTVVNNVETLAHAYTIFQYGAKKYYDLGVQHSRGTKIFSISGDTPKPGIYELELSINLQDFVYEFGDGDTKAVQVSGASGFLVPRKKFKDTAIDYKRRLMGISLPPGGSMILFNSSRSMFNVLDNYLEFFKQESCGQCTPCRVGCQQLWLGIKAVKRGEKPASYLDKLLRLAETMQLAAKCGLGQSVGNSFSSIVENFREEMIY